MKKQFKLSLTFFLFILFSQCGPTVEDAKNYHINIIHEQHLVVGYLNEMIGAFSSDEVSKIDSTITVAKDQVQKSIKVLEGMEAFDEDSELLTASLEFFKLIESQLNSEYVELFDLYKLPIEEYKDKERDRLNELNKIIDEKYYPVFDRFSKAEEEFADKWGFELIPGEL